MKTRYCLDENMNRLMLALQAGLPIAARPYQDLAADFGVSETEILRRLVWLKKQGLLKRINFSFDLSKLGVVSALVGCRIAGPDMGRAAKIIAACGQVTHNYARRHRLNMWFTISAASPRRLKEILTRLNSALPAEETVVLSTEKIYKLRFRFHAG
ncbi:MAG: hypothetical protein HQL23_02635 [Candidatus Omnitrophica bacterium]|nr:hypothetical protein [Candidatus Omnitrophota bacterium]